MEERIKGYSPVPGSSHEKQIEEGGFHLALYAVQFFSSIERQYHRNKTASGCLGVAILSLVNATC